MSELDLTAVQIHLKEAYLCVNCEFISNAKNDHCPVCQSNGLSLLPLKRVLDEAPVTDPNKVPRKRWVKV